MSMTTIQNLMKKKAELVEEMRNHGKTALNEVFKEFFAQHPTCKAIRWKQYTPYFNDGDTCEFSVRDLYLKMEDSAEDAGEYEDGFEDTYVYGEDSGRKEYAAAAQAVREISRIDDEIFELSFGDHVEVTATPKGFEVEGYGDHY